MNRKAWLIFTLALGSATPSAAQMQQEDGITLEQLRTLREAQFARLDTDGSDSLSRTEAAGNLGMRPGTAPQGGDDAAFLIADLDFSGGLSRTEFVEAPIPLLASIDANMDSRITQEEIAQARGAMGGRRN